LQQAGCVIHCMQPGRGGLCDQNFDGYEEPSSGSRRLSRIAEVKTTSSGGPPFSVRQAGASPWEHTQAPIHVPRERSRGRPQARNLSRRVQAIGEVPALRKEAVNVSASARAQLTPSTSTAGSTVRLNVYDLGLGVCCPSTGLNFLLRPAGYGVFHCGVEVYGLEWSYSYVLDAEDAAETGVFFCSPGHCERHTFSESVLLGTTQRSEMQVLKAVRTMQEAWLSIDYDGLRHNCQHFCEELCSRIGVDGIPSWVTNMANSSAFCVDNANRRASCCRDADESSELIILPDTLEKTRYAVHFNEDVRLMH